MQVSQQEQPPFKTIASRPMCRYPLSPRYDGHGDPSQAASFTCAKQ
jgi:feruloyl esterase